jgi:hypothetical protein
VGKPARRQAKREAFTKHNFPIPLKDLLRSSPKYNKMVKNYLSLEPQESKSSDEDSNSSEDDIPIHSQQRHRTTPLPARKNPKDLEGV